MHKHTLSSSSAIINPWGQRLHHLSPLTMKLSRGHEATGHSSLHGHLHLSAVAPSAVQTKLPLSSQHTLHRSDCNLVKVRGLKFIYTQTHAHMHTKWNHTWQWKNHENVWLFRQNISQLLNWAWILITPWQPKLLFVNVYIHLSSNGSHPLMYMT